jgi:hypothetical protein
MSDLMRLKSSPDLATRDAPRETDEDLPVPLQVQRLRTAQAMLRRAGLQVEPDHAAAVYGAVERHVDGTPEEDANDVRALHAAQLLTILTENPGERAWPTPSPAEDPEHPHFGMTTEQRVLSAYYDFRYVDKLTEDQFAERQEALMLAKHFLDRAGIVFSHKHVEAIHEMLMRHEPDNEPPDAEIDAVRAMGMIGMLVMPLDKLWIRLLEDTSSEIA